MLIAQRQWKEQHQEGVKLLGVPTSFDGLLMPLVKAASGISCVITPSQLQVTALDVVFCCIWPLQGGTPLPVKHWAEIPDNAFVGL